MKKNRKLTARMTRTAATFTRLALIASREAGKLAKLKHPKAEDLAAESHLRQTASDLGQRAAVCARPLQAEIAFSEP